MLRNVGSNWALILVTIAASYLLTPFIIHALGEEGYGTWTLITTLTGHISLLALGVPMACVRYLSQHVAAGDTRRMNQTIGSCVGLYGVVGVVAAVLGALLLLFFQQYSIPDGWKAESLLAFWVMVVTVSASFMGFLPEGILFAHHDFVRRNVIRMAGVLLRTGLTIGLLALDASLVALASIQLTCLAFDFFVSWLIISRRYPEVRIGLAGFNLGVVREIFSFSVWVLLLTAGARLSFESDALVIGAFMGVGAIPFYVVANSLIVYLIDFMTSIAAVVSPMTTKLNTEGRIDEVRAMFLKWSKVALSLTIMAGLFLCVLGPRFIAWWIDPSYEQPAGGVLQILMVSSFIFLPVRGVAVPILMGLGKPRMPALAFIAAGLLNVGLSMALIGPLGLAGVALGTAIPNVLFSLVVLTVVCRELDVSVAHWTRYVVPRATLGALPVLALLLWFRLGLQVQSLTGLLVAGIVMVLLFGLVWIGFVYRGDPYVDVRAQKLLVMRAWGRA
ncbi:MAG TPA: oligosaccharide flippase family protein [Vicinamibacterales bacterium]|nr:oligosaccharide flippase family protein [Vicinamibacterales bacterium]